MCFFIISSEKLWQLYRAGRSNEQNMRRVEMFCPFSDNCNYLIADRKALRGLAFFVGYMTEIVIFAGYYNTDLL